MWKRDLRPVQIARPRRKKDVRPMPLRCSAGPGTAGWGIMRDAPDGTPPEKAAPLAENGET